MFLRRKFLKLLLASPLAVLFSRFVPERMVKEPVILRDEHFVRPGDDSDSGPWFDTQTGKFVGYGKGGDNQ